MTASKIEDQAAAEIRIREAFENYRNLYPALSTDDLSDDLERMVEEFVDEDGANHHDRLVAAALAAYKTNHGIEALNDAGDHEDHSAPVDWDEVEERLGLLSNDQLSRPFEIALHGDQGELLNCGDCHRPICYDYLTERYHHLVTPEVGCFLIEAVVVGPCDRIGVGDRGEAECFAHEDCPPTRRHNARRHR